MKHDRKVRKFLKSSFSGVLMASLEMILIGPKGTMSDAVMTFKQCYSVTDNEFY